MKPRKLSSIPLKVKDAPSLTDKINADEALIRERLDRYVETPIERISIGSHVRYFIFDKKQAKYMLRLGGILEKTDRAYVILSNGELTWSVSTVIEHDGVPYPTKFWRILNNEQYQEKKHGAKAQELERQNQELRQMLEDFKKQMDAKRLETATPVKAVETPAPAKAIEPVPALETVEAPKQPETPAKRTRAKRVKVVEEIEQALETVEAPKQPETPAKRTRAKRPTLKECKIDTTL